MKRIIFTIVALIFSGSLRAKSCVNQHPHDHEDGSMNFLSNRKFTCIRASAERMRELRGFLPSGMFQISSSEENLVLNQFANLPDSHIEALVSYYRKGIFSGGVKTGNPGGGASGATMRQTGSNGYRLPLFIVLAPGKAAFAFLHEVGHALQDPLVMDLRKKGVDLNAATDPLYAEVRVSLGPDLVLRQKRMKPLPRCMRIFIVMRIQEERLLQLSHQKRLLFWINILENHTGLRKS